MKKPLLLLLAIICVTLASCSSDDSLPLNANIEGNWRLASYLANHHLEGPLVLDGNEVLFFFDKKHKKTIVANTVEAQYPYIITSGTYRLGGNDNEIIIDDIRYACTSENGALVLTHYTGGDFGETITIHLERLNENGI